MSSIAPDVAAIDVFRGVDTQMAGPAPWMTCTYDIALTFNWEFRVIPAGNCGN
jgi:hypothetical protein